MATPVSCLNSLQPSTAAIAVLLVTAPNLVAVQKSLNQHFSHSPLQGGTPSITGWVPIWVTLAFGFSDIYLIWVCIGVSRGVIRKGNKDQKMPAVEIYIFRFISHQLY